MPADPNPYAPDFPTLFVVAAWIQRHCIIPDGFRKGRPFRMYDWQLWCTLNHYRIKPQARQDRDFLAGDPDAIPIRSAAFHYRRSQVVAPQKTGKGPWSAAWVAAEGLGPVLFLDWAGENDAYVCEDVGCDCGWVYRYKPGEPMGHAWPTPLIQLLATSEDQVDNVYRPLKAMARNPRLKNRMLVREGFIRLRDDDGDPEQNRIDVVTSSALSRLGNPITFALQDETQLYTKSNKLVQVARTQRRGAAAMGGRSGETTNCWDPAQDSTAQQTFESTKADIFKFYEPPPPDLKYTVRVDRRRIHAFNYKGSPHADLHGINAEAEELLERDPAEAERFYGNRLVQGKGAWLPDGLWDRTQASVQVPPGAAICVGFDGSLNNDWTAIRCETLGGHRFTPRYGPDRRPTVWNPEEWGGYIPRGEVLAALDEIHDVYSVARGYYDPEDWESEIETLALKHGVERVLMWRTNRITQMYEAIRRTETDLITGASTHDDCPLTAASAANARKAAKAGQKYVLAKPADNQKIDPSMADILAHEAAADARAAGWTDEPEDNSVLVFR